MKQIDTLMGICSETVLDDFEMQASLHGRKTKPRNVAVKTEEKEDEKMNKLMQEMYESKKAEARTNK